MLDRIKDFSTLSPPPSFSPSKKKERLKPSSSFFSDGLEVERSIEPSAMTVDTSDLSLSAYPINITLRHLSEEESTPTQVGTVPNGLFRSNILSDDEVDASTRKGDADAGKEEFIRAKRVVGCDGARSWVRK